MPNEKTVDVQLKAASERRLIADALVADQLGAGLMEWLLDNRANRLGVKPHTVGTLLREIQIYATDEAEGLLGVVNNALEARHQHMVASERFLADVSGR
jgi:hypothetical protein